MGGKDVEKDPAGTNNNGPWPHGLLCVLSVGMIVMPLTTVRLQQLPDFVQWYGTIKRQEVLLWATR